MQVSPLTVQSHIIHQLGWRFVVPHDIDWVKDRVRWYWHDKLMKRPKLTAEATSESTATTSTATATNAATMAAVEEEKKPDPITTAT